MNRILATKVSTIAEAEYIISKYKIHHKLDFFERMLEQEGSIYYYYSREDGTPYWGWDEISPKACVLTEIDYIMKQIILSNKIGGTILE